MLLIIILNSIALAGAIAWAIFEPGFEPIITSTALTGSLYALKLGKTPIKEVKEFIESVVFRKDFLSDLPPIHKREALLAMVKPSSYESELYPNINDYYVEYIDKFTNLGSDGFRSNYVITSQAEVDKNDSNLIKVVTSSDFRIYPTQTGYKKLVFGFDGTPEIAIRLHSPTGESWILGSSDTEAVETADGFTRYEIDLSKHFDNPKFMHVSISYTEQHSDIDALLTYRFFTPIDGFQYTLICGSGLKIGSVANFLSYETVSIETSHSQLKVVCAGWVNDGEGLAVSVKADNE